MSSSGTKSMSQQSKSLNRGMRMQHLTLRAMTLSAKIVRVTGPGDTVRAAS